MSLLDLLILTALTTTIIMFSVGNRPGVAWFSVILYAIQLVFVALLGYQLSQSPSALAVSAINFNVMGNPLTWSMSGLGWFFAVITIGAALFSAWYSAGKWSQQEYSQQAYSHKQGLRLFHGALALNVLAMLILLSSGDLLSLFIGWELVSWASYLIMAQRGGLAARAALRYIVYAMAGAMAILVAIIMLRQYSGSLQFDAVRHALASAPDSFVWAIMVLFGSGFLVKMAMVPFHLWQAEAYSETPGPAAAFLGAISSRMGLFALLIVLVQLIGFERLAAMDIVFSFLDAKTLWSWLAAITIVIPTYIALTQSDARLLLAWHGIGQGGYMLLGIMVATPLGVSGGLLHVFNYATNQAVLFLAVTAVLYRTGTTDLDRLGGLVTRMPLSFLAMLLGIIGLAGLPPMNGFVSKWMVYKSLIDNGMPLLFLAAAIGTLGTILSVYKLIHNTFLGQLRLEHQEINEVPWSMSVPMLLVGALVFITGYMPGLALDMVSLAQQALGVAPLNYSLGGVQTAHGSLNMLWVVSILIISIGIGTLVFFLGNRSSKVHQLDNYAGGHFLSADIRYHYSHNFYAGLMRVIGPWYRGSIVWLEAALGSTLQFSSSVAHGLYHRVNAAFYLPAVLLLALMWMWI
jgi:formate hydrogenlyase subunit 3/multisubunit Na+/H+ antiporter MnhD subunit